MLLQTLVGTQWPSGRVLDLTEGLRVQASLGCVLEQDSLILALVLVQPRKTCPNITEKLLTWT